MKLTLKRNETDISMVDLLGEDPRGRPILWGVVHDDFVCNDQEIRDALEVDGQVAVTVTMDEI